MSSTLVRRSLELVDSDITNQPGKSQKKSKHKKSKQKKSEAGLKAVKKPAKKLVKKGTESQMTVDELRMRLRVHEDQTEGNVCFLQRLAGNNIDEDMANKIFARAVKASKDQQEVKHEPQGTVFTEEDFEKFEKEYFAC